MGKQLIYDRMPRCELIVWGSVRQFSQGLLAEMVVQRRKPQGDAEQIWQQGAGSAIHPQGCPPHPLQAGRRGVLRVKYGGGSRIRRAESPGDLGG